MLARIILQNFRLFVHAVDSVQQYDLEEHSGKLQLNTGIPDTLTHLHYNYDHLSCPD